MRRDKTESKATQAILTGIVEAKHANLSRNSEPNLQSTKKVNITGRSVFQP